MEIEKDLSTSNNQDTSGDVKRNKDAYGVKGGTLADVGTDAGSVGGTEPDDTLTKRYQSESGGEEEQGEQAGGELEDTDADPGRSDYLSA